MSVAIYIVCESELEGEDTFVDGKALGHIDPNALEKLEKQIGCRPLYEFMSQNPDDMAEFLEDMEDSAIAPEEWFAAKDGLQTVRGLHKYIQANPSSVANAGDVLEDLSECERVLKLLDAHKVGFHFAIDY